MKYLAEREERTLLKLVKDRKGKRPERDVVLLELAVKTGLRLAEIHGLNVGDIRGMEKLYVRPEIAKRSRPRTLPIHKEMQHILKNFLKLKLQWKEGIHDNDPLFVSRKGIGFLAGRFKGYLKNGASRRDLFLISTAK
jgi:integrase